MFWPPIRVTSSLLCLLTEDKVSIASKQAPCSTTATHQQDNLPRRTTRHPHDHGALCLYCTMFIVSTLPPRSRHRSFVTLSTGHLNPSDQCLRSLTRALLRSNIFNILILGLFLVKIGAYGRQLLEIRWGITSVGAPCLYSLSTAHRRHGLLPEQHRSVRVCPSSGEKTDTTVCPWISPEAHDVEHTCAETTHASFQPLD